jgi:hypothetical protein
VPSTIYRDKSDGNPSPPPATETLLFAVALTAATVAAALSITLAGIPLLVAAAAVIHGCHFPNGLTAHGVQLGYFPNGPSGHGAVGVYVDTLPKALLAALVFLLVLVPFSYLLALTARTHASVARALLRPPEDPLAPAKDLLRRSGPLPSFGQNEQWFEPHP